MDTTEIPFAPLPMGGRIKNAVPLCAKLVLQPSRTALKPLAKVILDPALLTILTCSAFEPWWTLTAEAVDTINAGGSILTWVGKALIYI